MDDISIANYADDNAPFVFRDVPLNVMKSLENVAEKLFEWFANNHVKANHDKCHLLLSTLTPISIKIKDYIIKKVSAKLPPGKFPPIKIPSGKFPPGKFPPRKLPPGILPPMFLNIPTRVFKFFVFSLFSPSSLILLKILFSNSMF